MKSITEILQPTLPERTIAQQISETLAFITALENEIGITKKRKQTAQVIQLLNKQRTQLNISRQKLADLEKQLVNNSLANVNAVAQVEQQVNLNKIVGQPQVLANSSDLQMRELARAINTNAPNSASVVPPTEYKPEIKVSTEVPMTGPNPLRLVDLGDLGDCTDCDSDAPCEECANESSVFVHRANPLNGTGVVFDPIFTTTTGIKYDSGTGVSSYPLGGGEYINVDGMFYKKVEESQNPSAMTSFPSQYDEQAKQQLTEKEAKSKKLMKGIKIAGLVLVAIVVVFVSFKIIKK